MTHSPSTMLRPFFSLTLLLAAPVSIAQAEDAPATDLLATDNLMAWCIVPFDASQRTPQARAEMLQQLGINKVAYDWRERHVAEFEDEIIQYQKHGLEYFAFWSWHDAMEPLIHRYGIRPQIWAMLPHVDADTEDARIKQAAEHMLPLVQKTAELGCSLGLYNHGGWGGEPSSMAAVCAWLKKHHQADHVGIVYNFHHGHEHMKDFAQHFEVMKPWLLCVNINGMADAAQVQQGQNKILALGQGTHETRLLKIVLASGYQGPIGILDHQSDRDTQEVLQENLNGLATIREKLK